MVMRTGLMRLRLRFGRRLEGCEETAAFASSPYCCAFSPVALAPSFTVVPTCAKATLHASERPINNSTFFMAHLLIELPSAGR